MVPVAMTFCVAFTVHHGLFPLRLVRGYVWLRAVDARMRMRHVSRRVLRHRTTADTRFAAAVEPRFVYSQD